MCFGGALEVADQTEERVISVPESRLVLIGWFFNLRKRWGFRERGRGEGGNGEVVDIVLEDFRKAVVQLYSLGKKKKTE
jgi:hypothetical protein